MIATTQSSRNSDLQLRVDNLVTAGQTRKFYTGAAWSIVHSGEVAASGVIGTVDDDPESQPVSSSTRFDMASLTKPLSAICLLKSVEHGELHLLQTVSSILPEAAESTCASITLRQLATHTSGLPPWKALYEDAERPAYLQILSTPLDSEPGMRYAYSDLGYILLGTCLERASGSELGELIQARICKPLGLTRTGYLPVTEPGDVAATRNCPWRGTELVLRGQVHDANAWSMGGVSAHAGVFSTLDDMTRITQAILSGRMGRAVPEPLLGRQALALASRNQISPQIGGHSIGWFTPPNGMLPGGDLLSAETFGHTGFTGTSLVMDPSSDIGVLLLTNRVFSPAEGTEVLKLRRLVANLAAGILCA